VLLGIVVVFRLSGILGIPVVLERMDISAMLDTWTGMDTLVLCRHIYPQVDIWVMLDTVEWFHIFQ